MEESHDAVAIYEAWGKMIRVPDGIKTFVCASPPPRLPRATVARRTIGCPGARSDVVSRFRMDPPLHYSNRRNLMDDLDRLLRSVGKSAFVRFYSLFADPGVPDADIVEMLSREYTVAASRTRTSKARRIFREGRQREALERIAGSQRTDPEASALAARLLRNQLAG